MGRLRESVVSGTPTVVEIPAAETTVDFSQYVTNTAVVPTTITIEVVGTAGADANAVTFTMSVNGVAQGGDGKMTLNTGTPLLTEFTFPATTLSLSFAARTSAFHFTGAVSTEITLPSEHIHVTVDGIETAVDLPALTTVIEVSESTNIIVDLPEVTTTLEFTAETYTFSMEAYTISSSGGTSYCGTQSTDSAENSACVMGITTTVTLPTGATDSVLYLIAPGTTTGFTLPGITTTFVPEKTITTVDVEQGVSCHNITLYYFSINRKDFYPLRVMQALLDPERSTYLGIHIRGPKCLWLRHDVG